MSSKTEKTSKILFEAIAASLLIWGVMLARLWIFFEDYSHPESNAFLQVYTSGRGLLQTIYDPLLTDWNHYQARELSYLCDWLDAHIILWTAKRHCVSFFSWVSAFIYLSIVFIQQYFIRRYLPRVNRWMAAAVSLFLVLSPVCDGLSFFRSAKPLAALGITVCGFALMAIYHARDGKPPLKAWMMYTAGILLLPYTDRQGAFAAAAFTGAGGSFLLFFSFAKARKHFGIASNHCRLIAAASLLGLLSIALAACYNVAVAPALIEHFNGYRPSFEFQHLPEGAALNFFGGTIFLFDNIGHGILRLFNLPATLAGFLLMTAWIGVLHISGKQRPALDLLALTVAGALAAMLLSANLMTSRHPLMLRLDVIYSVYFLPMSVMLLLLYAMTLDALPIAAKKSRIVFSCVMPLAILLAIASPLLPAPKSPDHLGFYKKTAVHVKRAINDRNFEYERVTLPFSSVRLIEHFRERTK